MDNDDLAADFLYHRAYTHARQILEHAGRGVPIPDCDPGRLLGELASFVAGEMGSRPEFEAAFAAGLWDAATGTRRPR